MMAYTGKPQGTVVTSRHKIAEALASNNNTIYKALKRLEKAEMVTSKVTNKYTTYRICKWHTFQTDGNRSGNNKVTTKEQQSNTLIRIKNKEIVSKDTMATASYGKPEINEMFTYWKEATGLPISSRVQQNRHACHNLIKKHGVAGVRKLVSGVAQAQSDQYAPRIANFIQLQNKLDDLMAWGKKKSTNRGVKI